jgi:hypothetical protein
MEDILCNISAWRYHRTPPQIRALCPQLPPLEADKNRIGLKTSPLVQESIGLPVHLMVAQRERLSCNPAVRRHLKLGELPPGSIWETEHGINVTSPLMTVFSFAETLSSTELTMMLYEVCGTFSVYRPTAKMTALLRQAYRDGIFQEGDGWKWVQSAEGSESSLWRRPPLARIDELRSFCDAMNGHRGIVKFKRAARDVFGVCASPFEVQTAMLLGLSRRRGGEGFCRLATNERISLTRVASRIAGQNTAYADIVLRSRDGSHEIILECQSRQIHARYGAGIADAKRATALQSMGYPVVMITSEQLFDEEQFEQIVKTACDLLGERYREKTSHSEAAQHRLRRELFINWETLGE